MTAAYADEESATPSRGDEPLVWPITSAESVVAVRPPEPIITFVNLLVAFIAALGLAFMIARTLCGPSMVRKLGQSIVGRRPDLASNLIGSGIPDPAATQAEVSRKPAERNVPASNDQDLYIEASVQRLLQELKRRQNHDRPRNFEWTKRKVIA